ncbi:hypothetical protein HG537_0G03190 [Torulaspora globosa]|uniref:Uncharacterized protein n=1 Tax=Torulaspora globosa TaxID=48254 RepID=A0A7H9HWG3_9SACH|nr:hypothetical protein HG537_0G03190 [Torulaspora sp. CBS 2947]
MYSTVYGTCKDNSSVYSGSSTNTSNSTAVFGRNGRIIPRSNSTSDLYEIPATAGAGNGRKKQFSAVISRNRSQPSLQVSSGGGGLYRSQSRSNSCYSLEQKNILKSIPEMRQPNYVLTPYQLQRKQMKDSFQFPNGESFTPRSRLGNVPRSNSSTTLSNPGRTLSQVLSRSQSMNSLPLESPRYQKPSMTIASSSPSPVGSRNSNSSYNSMRDHSSNGSTNPSSGPSAHNSNTALHLAADEKSHFILAATLATSGDTKRPSVTVDGRGAEKSNNLSDEERPSVVPASAPLDEKLEAKRDDKKDCEKDRGSSLKRQPGSGTKLGAFFKKIFSLSSSRNPSPTSSASSSSTSIVSLSQLSPLNLARRKKRRRMDTDISGSTVSSPRPDGRPVSSKPKLEASQPKAGSDDQTQTTENVEVCLPTEDEQNDEDCDDILMDTDLVFDSLLLKADIGRPSYQQKQTEPWQELKNPPNYDSSSAIDPVDARHGETFKEAESNIDYELISEFSRLGTFIEDSSKTAHANLPPRSARRPTLPDKELAKSFYHPVYGETDFGHYLIKRLYQDWKVVHLDEALHKDDTKAAFAEKRLRFADEIYVNDTWSQYDYQRSDKRFIKNRRRMMQLEKGAFIQAIKLELNEFKRNEMVVHQESVRFTHLFS